MSDYIDIKGRYYKFVFYNYLTDEGIKLIPRSCTLTKFVANNIIIEDVAIPGAPQLQNYDPRCRLFSEVGRLLFINILQLFKDLFASNLCLHMLHPDDIIILLDEGNVVKFRQGLSYVAANESMISKNFAMLAQILHKNVLAKYQNWIGEINDLLDLLTFDGFNNMDLIFAHPSLLDICDKIDAFTRAHTFLLTRLKVYHPRDYNAILAALVFQPDWETLVILNPYLLGCYNARKMDNQKKVKAQKLGLRNGLASGSTQVLNQTGNGPKLGTEPPNKGKASATGSTQVLNQAGNGPKLGTEPPNKGKAPATGSTQVLNQPGNGPKLGTEPPNKGKAPATTQAKVGNLHPQSTSRAFNLPGDHSRLGPKLGTTPQIKEKAPATPIRPTQKNVGNLHQPTLPALNHPRNHSINGPKLGTAAQIKGKAPPTPTQSTKIKTHIPKYNLPGSDPREEVLAFYRNVGVHGLDRSMKKWRELYGLRGLNIMLLSTLPHLSSSLMYALHRYGFLHQASMPKLLK